MPRIILLLDLDAFYAQAEMNRNPDLRGKAVVVCMYSGRSKDSGAVAASSYEARNLGIRAGMPISRAKQLGKEAVFLPADREYYSQVSERVMAVLEDYATVEQVSIDEAYLDLSNAGGYGKAEEISKKIKEKIRKQENLTCSVGIGPNKLIAKMASGMEKPDGLKVVREGEVKKLLKNLPVKDLFSIGPKTGERLNEMGVKTIGDLAVFDRETLVKEFGNKRGLELHNYANGIDDRPVEPREKQQLSRLATLKEDTKDFNEISDMLSDLSGKLYERVRKEGVSFRTVTFIAIGRNLQIATRSKTLEEERSDLKSITENGKSLVWEYLQENPDTVLRRIGISVSNFRRPAKKQRRLGDFG